MDLTVRRLYYSFRLFFYPLGGVRCKQLLKLHIQHNSRFILYTISGIYQSRFQHIFLAGNTYSFPVSVCHGQSTEFYIDRCRITPVAYVAIGFTPKSVIGSRSVSKSAVSLTECDNHFVPTLASLLSNTAGFMTNACAKSLFVFRSTVPCG